jgi:O-antigen/teichoic acid export membrane protein
VTYLNLLAGVIMLLLMAVLIPKHGLLGAAIARLAYGPITCLAYLQLYRTIWRTEPHMLVSEPPTYEAAAASFD